MILQFDCGDFNALAYEDAFFDVVWALESVCHFPEKSEFYKEANRLLRPGGRLVVGEFMRSERDLSEQDERVMDEWMSGWVMPGLTPPGSILRERNSLALLRFVWTT